MNTSQSSTSRRLVAAIAVAVLAAAASAQEYKFNCTFDDGGTGFGTFKFDPTATVYNEYITDWSITTTAGTNRDGFPDSSYNPTSAAETGTIYEPIGGTSFEIAFGSFSDSSDYSALYLEVTTPPPTTGLENVNNSGDFINFISYEASVVNNTQKDRRVTSGYIEVLTTPEPAPFAVLGLGALGLLARRRRSTPN